MTFDISPLRDLYPWDGHWLDLGAHRMHYLDEGRGQPLVMVHGNPTWSFYWRHLVTGLSDAYRCIVPDHIGCGRSDKPDDEHYRYTLDQRVDDLDALIDHLDLNQKITLLVHDWGGMIGLAWATRHPERVSRIVLLNTGGFGLPPGKQLPKRIGVVRHLPFFSFPTRRLNLFARGAAFFCSAVPGRMNSKVKAGYLAPYDSWENRIAVQRFVEDIPLKPGHPAWDTVQTVSDRLSQFDTVPVLICWGGKDFVFDRHFLAEFRRRLPSARVHEFPEAGHYVLEDAHEQILPLVKDFLQTEPTS